MDTEKTPKDEKRVHHYEAGSVAKSARAFPAKPFAIAFVAVVALGASFYSGALFQKHHQKNGNSAAVSGQMAAAGFRRIDGEGGRFRSMVSGTVTAISPSSITVKATDGSSKTYTINSDTRIEDNGQVVDYSDIKTDSTVMVLPNASDESIAARIMANVAAPNTSDSITTPLNAQTN